MKDDKQLVLWGRCSEFPNYLVSNQGQIKNSIGDILSQSISRDYFIIGMTRVLNGHKERKTVRVHRIVASQFIPNDDPENKPTVNHKNGIKTDNRAVNLEWMSVRDNKRESYKLGHNKYKTTPDDVRAVREMSEKGMKGRDIAYKIGLCPSMISDILSGKKWSYVK